MKPVRNAENIPAHRMGLSRLTRMAFSGSRMDQLSSKLLIESFSNPDNPGVLMDLATVEQLRGNEKAGLEFQRSALQQNRAFTTDMEEVPLLKLLVLSAPIEIGGNTPVEFLLENSGINLINYYVGLEALSVCDFPEHDLIFVAAPGDDSASNPYIQHIDRLILEHGLQVINAPEQIMKLDRDQLPELLCDVPNTIVPPIIRVSKPDLLGNFSNCENLCHFENLVSEPFVVRPTASHAGKGLELLSDRNELAAYTTKHDADEYFVSKFVDYRSADGNFRKYRIIFIDGKAYPFHLAIGDSWKLWYMNAHMGSCKKKLAEEADFLRTFDQYFATLHADALKSISERVDLEYFGIDCAVGKTGELIVFEADNAMIVHDMDAVGEFSYKQEAMTSLFAAFEELILKENSSISKANRLNNDRVLKADMPSLA